MRDLLVIVQVCLCVVLMVVSAMFSQAVLSMFAMEPGFETRHVLAVPLQFSPDRYSASDAEVFYTTLEDRIAAIAQVDQVATSNTTPLAAEPDAAVGGTEFRLPAQVSAQAHSATVRVVSRNYFAALDIPLLHGDGFPPSESDGSAAIVSQSFVAAFWPRQDPIGQPLLSSNGRRLRVIGVARDNHTGYTNEPDAPTIYLLRNKPAVGDQLLVRFRGDVTLLAAQLNRIVHDLDPQMLVLSSTLRAQMDDQAEAGWLIGKMLLFVAMVAVMLALLGIYGVVAYSVSRRTREFGIRSALGATPRDMVTLVLFSGVKPVIAGTLAGLACAFFFSLAVIRVLRQAPIPLSSSGPVPYAAVGASLIIAAMVAMIGPACRAARVEPLVALRDE